MKAIILVAAVSLIVYSCKQRDKKRDEALDWCIHHKIKNINGHVISYEKKYEHEEDSNIYWAHVKIQFHSHLNEVNEKEDTIVLHSPLKDVWNCHQ